MTLINVIRLLLMLVAIIGSDAADTDGIEFWTAFLSNKPGQTANISLTFMNKDTAATAFVNISYTDYTANPSTIIYQNVTVGANNTATVDLPSNLLLFASSVMNAINRIPPISIYITSTQSISVIASNMAADGLSGDRFIVLPTNMIQTYYVIGGMNQTNATSDQLSEVLILTTQDNTSLTITSIASDGTNQTATYISPMGGSVYKGSFPFRYTLVISATQNVALIVGANCFSYANGSCDHQAYMPLPLSSACLQSSSSDLYLTAGLFNAINTYAFSASAQCYSQFEIDNQPNPPRLTPESPVLFSNLINDNETQTQLATHYIRSDTNPIQITRLGPMQYGGTFISSVPSVQQFVSGTVLFYRFEIESYALIFADLITTNTYNFNCNSTSVVWTNVIDQPVYFYSIVPLLPSIGMCTFSSNSRFMITVYGRNQFNASYAYVASMNLPAYLTNVTTTTTTTSPATTTPFTTTTTGTTTTTISGATTTTTNAGTGSTTTIELTTTTTTAGATGSSTPTTTTTPFTGSTTTALTTTTTSSSTTTPSFADTDGTEFWLAFLPNIGDQQNTNISITFINKNIGESATVNVYYLNSTDPPSAVINQDVIVGSLSSTTITLPTYLLFASSTGGGANLIPDVSIYITSTHRISAIASNIAMMGNIGDRFIVLPTAMLQTYYVVGGMNQVSYFLIDSSQQLQVNPSTDQMSIVYLISTQDGTSLTYTTILPGGNNQTLSIGNFDAGSVYRITFSNQYTLIVNATQKLAIIVGANCFAYANGQCDHQSYMALPLLPDCLLQPQGDIYFAGGFFGNANMYSFAASAQCVSQFEIDNQPNPPRLTPASPVLFYNMTPEGVPPRDVHFIKPDTNPIQMTRIGQLNASGGIFFTSVPSTRQYVTGSTLFYSFEANSSIYIFADNQTTISYSLSCGSVPTAISWTTIPNYPAYSSATFQIQSVGLCTFTANGVYMLAVYGQTSSNSSYAYIPAMNSPAYLSPVTTTTSASTTTTTTGTTTTTVSGATTTTTTITGPTTTTAGATGSSTPTTTTTPFTGTTTTATTETTTPFTGTTTTATTETTTPFTGSTTTTTPFTGTTTTATTETTTPFTGSTTTTTPFTGTTTTATTETTTPFTGTTTTTTPFTGTATTATTMSTTTSGAITPTLSPSMFADSEGLEFWTAFLGNKRGLQPNALISLTFLNKNAAVAFVNVSYTNQSATPTTITYDNVTVGSASSATRQLPAYLLYHPVTGGLNQIPPIWLYITSTQRISIIASNIFPDGSSGDRFVVLPKTMLRTYYVVGGMNQTNANVAEQYSEILILITESATVLNYTILPIGSGNNNVVIANLPVGTVYKSSFPGQYTAIITASKPIALIAGASCFAYANGLCDHQSYMPLPLVPTCRTTPFNDVYLAGALFGDRNTYSLAGSQQCYTSVAHDNQPNPPRLTPESPVLFTDFTPEGTTQPRNIHYIMPDLNPIVLSRIGQLNDSSGIFLTIVPSLTQFVTGTTLFYSFDTNSSALVFGDNQTISTYNISCISNVVWIQVPEVIGYYYATISLPTTGVCIFTSNGVYSITVYGKTSQNSSYAYVPAMNIPQYLLETTTTQTTTSSSGTTTTVTTATPTTTTAVGTGSTTTGTTTTMGTGSTTTGTTTTMGTGSTTTGTTTTMGTGPTTTGTTTTMGTGPTTTGTTTTMGTGSTTTGATTTMGTGPTTTGATTTIGTGPTTTGATTTMGTGSTTITTTTMETGSTTTVTPTTITTASPTTTTESTMTTTPIPAPVYDNYTYSHPFSLGNASSLEFNWTVSITQGITIILNVTSGNISLVLTRCIGTILQSARATCNRTTSFCQQFYNATDLLNFPPCNGQRADDANLTSLYGLLTTYGASNVGQLNVLPGDQRIEQQPVPTAAPSSGLSAGEIVLIVLASVLLICLVIAIGFAIFAYKRRRNKNSYKLSDATATSGSTVIQYRQHWQ